jgi:teichoic acid transport system ATP-binding protein
LEALKVRPKIVFSNISKSFNLYKKQSDKLLEIISFKDNKDNFFALKNVSFEIFEGEAIGIVGLNGSGKSTLSNLLAQIIPPTSGDLTINGETSLIAISAGLNNQLTGLENIELKCLMHGLKKEEIQQLKTEIINFADLGKFIDQPVKNYSSGMKSRLGFAISVHTNPDILIVDEALSVGDQTFYDKCLQKINEFKSQGKTIIFISHSLSQIKAFCDRVMWIHFGRMKKLGEVESVLKEYQEFIQWFNSLNAEEKVNYKAKMLDDQYKEEDTKSDFNPFGRQTYRKRHTPIKKKSNILFSLQCIILVLAVLTSATLMLGAHPVQSIGKYISNQLTRDEVPTTAPDNNVSQEVTHQKDIAEVINENGIVTVGQSALYDEKELKTAKGKIFFSDEIEVLEKIGDSYKVRTANNLLGYTNVENIKVPKPDFVVAQRDLKDFLPLFPERFANAYAYFLTFLNVESEEVKSILSGLTSESLLDNGKKTLTYSYYNAQYTVNDDNMTESISISNIETSVPGWNELKESASLVSNDNQYYYYITEDYKIVIDILNRTATVSLII